MWRGLEVILKGRDPRDAWAFVQRICGVCTGTHALTIVRAVEDALKIDIPENANSIRNIMQLSLQVHDHLVHFYHLHALDWVDVVNALKADPRPPASCSRVSPSHPNARPAISAMCRPPAQFVESGQLGPFKNGYWTNPAYKLPPEANLMAVTHYLEALDFQKESCGAHHLRRQGPAPQLAGGRRALRHQPRRRHGRRRADQHGRLNYVIDITQRCIEFVKNVYMPDVIAIGGFYKSWLYGGACRTRR
jgi:hydrogenase large subunit